MAKKVAHYNKKMFSVYTHYNYEMKGKRKRFHIILRVYLICAVYKSNTLNSKVDQTTL